GSTHATRSTRKEPAGLHGVQAAELHEHEVEAEYTRPARGQEVLPLVGPPHPAPGDALDGAGDTWGAAGAPPLPGGPPPPPRPPPRPSAPPEPAREPRAAGIGGVRGFIGESIAE